MGAVAWNKRQQTGKSNPATVNRHKSKSVERRTTARLFLFPSILGF